MKQETDKTTIYGGKAAREGKGPLWKFTDDNNGTFQVPDADYVSALYFPIMNHKGMKCFVTPELKGDIAISYHNYLTTPVVTEDLHRTVSNRNFWISVDGKKPWSATGVSAAQRAKKWNKKSKEFSTVTGGIGWFKTERINKKLGIKTTATVFVPSTPDYVEITIWEVENIGEKAINFKPTAATPLYGRSTENLRDHRQVTTMFQKVFIEEAGVRIKGNIYHDERGGHTPNKTHYAMIGFDQKGKKPEQIWGSLNEFIGEGGSLDNPEALFLDKKAPQIEPGEIDGQEAVSAIQFKKEKLHPNEKKSYIILHCITENPQDLALWRERFGTLENAQKSLETTKEYWQKMTNGVSFETPDKNFDNWTKWLAFQLKTRQIFGNSYLPDFGYGKGGRGWRDLWQDLLSIFLVDAESAKEEIENNFLGVSIDGTNATLIGNNSGEFKSDVNNIARTWCDHSSWPLFVLDFYMNQTGDFDILLKDLPYWKDSFYKRAKAIDHDWNKEQGFCLKTHNGHVYNGSIIEHLLLQNVCSFFNVGQHNNILLECADWNDTYDNAREKGESVCFHNFFAHNLTNLAQILQYLKDTKNINELDLLEETAMLFDNLHWQENVDYNNPEAKQQRLQAYYECVKHTVSGNRIKINIDEIINDLKAKANSMYEHIRNNEWLTTKDNKSFFNGHYDNDSVRIHGDHKLGVRIDLTSQVLPTMFETATDEQVKQMFDAVKFYLKDEKTGGLKLCTDLKELKLNYGRVAAFAYGYKEHGSKWMHQNIMYTYGLYGRNLVEEGYEVFKGMYDLVMNSGMTKIFPSIPSFFTRYGRGMYNYQTGSAAWLVLTLTTQVFGIRGEKGNLCINPKLVKEQFDKDGKTQITCNFLNKRLQITYKNKKKKNWNKYSIKSIKINGQKAATLQSEGAKAIIDKDVLNRLCNKDINEVKVNLE